MTPLWTAQEAAAATAGKATGAWSANGVSIDSRTLQRDDIFVALMGENRDGHVFVADALDKGAAVAMVSRAVEGIDPTKLLIVADTLRGLEGLGAAARSRTGAKIAAVTGSVGKTSTKEALKFALGLQGATHASEASYNNLWGVPLTLARMPAGTRFGIFEIGMNHADEIRPLTRQVKPDVAMVTTVEPVHIEHFDSVEGIADAKAEIFEGLASGGIAVINADNPHAARLAAAANAAGARVWTFGEAGAEALLASVSLGDSSSEVEANILGERVRFTYGAPGRHFVQNALGLLLVVKALGADVQAAASALRAVRAVKGRGERHTIRIDGGSFDLIDESYNANPASMRAALALLAQCGTGPGGRRIAILGDMLELGSDGPAMHADIAASLAQPACDRVFACGPLMSHLWAALPASIRGAWSETSSDIAGLVSADVRPGDVVMIKGSLGSRMSLVVDALKARALEAAAG